jgi:hypothetical protein
MDERDKVAVSAAPGAFVDEFDTSGLERRQLGGEVLDSVGKMMKLRRLVAKKSDQRRIVRERSQQLDRAVSCTHADDFDTLIVDALAVSLAKSECGKGRLRRCEVGDDDGDVVQGPVLHQTAATGL